MDKSEQDQMHENKGHRTDRLKLIITILAGVFIGLILIAGWDYPMYMFLGGLLALIFMVWLDTVE